MNLYGQSLKLSINCRFSHRREQNRYGYYFAYILLNAVEGDAVVKSRSEVSAGGIVFRKRDDNVIEVLICKAASYHKWVLPKGLVDKGEALDQTAVREVAEEVGVTARIVSELGEPERYIYSRQGIRIFKEVHYFLMEYVSGSETQHDHEMEAVAWVPIQEAIDRVAYEGAKDILRRAVTLLQASA